MHLLLKIYIQGPDKTNDEDRCSKSKLKDGTRTYLK